MAKLPEKLSSTGHPSSSCSIYTNSDWMGKWGRGRKTLNNMPGPTLSKYEEELEKVEERAEWLRTKDMWEIHIILVSKIDNWGGLDKDV